MELITRFENIRDRARQELKGAASSEPTERLAKLVGVAQECERAVAQIQGLEEMARRLDAELDVKQPPISATAASAISPQTGRPLKRRSGKAEGKAERKELLLHMQEVGTPLQWEGGRIYRTVSGKRAGIGFATEDRQGDKWWLGVPDEALDIYVLLCKAQSGDRLHFILPSDFMSKVRPFLSTNRSDLIFHVRRSGTTYELADAPQSGLKAINQYLNRFDLLR